MQIASFVDDAGGKRKLARHRKFQRKNSEGKRIGLQITLDRGEGFRIGQNITIWMNTIVK